MVRQNLPRQISHPIHPEMDEVSNTLKFTTGKEKEQVHSE
jgi:hypothetical protein